ncbi:hypothetical protein D3C77_652590 [compost metagenome]
MGQLLQGLGVHVATRLVLAALDQVERQVLQLALVGRSGLFLHGGHAGSAEQGIESTSETFFLDRHAGSLSQAGTAAWRRASSPASAR